MGASAKQAGAILSRKRHKIPLVCPICGKSCQRLTTAKFCGRNCRQASYMQRKKAATVVAP